MKKRVLTFTLALLLCLGLAAPVLAEENQAPEITITWLEDDIQLYGSGIYEYIGVKPQKGTPIPVRGKIDEETWGYGAINAEGNFVIPLTYGLEMMDDMPIMYSEGLASVWVGDFPGWENLNARTVKCNYVDMTGSVVLTLDDGVYGGPFFNGIAVAVKFDDWGDCLFGMIDRTGKTVMPFEYDSLCLNLNGPLIAAEKDGKCGYIDINNSAVVPLEYDATASFGGYSFLGNLVVTMNYDKDNSRYVYYGFDSSGKLVLEKYDKIGNMGWDGYGQIFNDYGEFRVVQKNEKWGVVNQDGKIVISAKYDSMDIGFASDQLLVAYTDVGSFYIDTTTGAIVDIKEWRTSHQGETDVTAAQQKLEILQQYDSSTGYIEGLAVVGNYDSDRNMKYGFVDETGTEVIPLKSDDAELIMNGYIGVVRSGDRYGIFENPYYVSPEPYQNHTVASAGGFPVLLVVLVIAVAAAAAVALMLYRKGKLNKEGVTEVTAAVTQSAAAGTAKVAATVSQAASAGAAKVSETAGKAKTAVKQMGGVTCSCGAVNPVTAKFCQSCGKPVVIPGKCPSCGHQNAPEAKFCQNCGAPLAGGEDTHEA